jgi:hypothetical protein
LNGLTSQQGQTNGSANSIADAETELVHDVIDQVSKDCANARPILNFTPGGKL